MTFLFTDIEGSTRLWETEQIGWPMHWPAMTRCAAPSRAHGGRRK
jgi:hypothetical protein